MTSGLILDRDVAVESVVTLGSNDHYQVWVEEGPLENASCAPIWNKAQWRTMLRQFSWP